MNPMNPFRLLQQLSDEEKAEELKKNEKVNELEIEKKFVRDYNKLVKKYKRTLVARLDIAKVQDDK